MPDREALGRRVREVWVEWARAQPDAKPSWLLGWYEIGEGQREVDRLIGEALAAAGLERLRASQRVELARRRLAHYDHALSGTSDPGGLAAALRAVLEAIDE